MGMSFPVSFLLGQELARSVGATDPADLAASGITLAVTGGTPVGIVLTRQIALNRAEQESQIPGRTPSTGTEEQPVSTRNKVLDQWLENSRQPGESREEAKQRLVTLLTSLANELQDLPDEPVSAQDVEKELGALQAAFEQAKREVC
jgi:hypothetical protein